MALQILEKEHGEHIFTLTPTGTDYSTPVMFALCKAVSVQTLDAQVCYVNRSLLIGHTAQAAITFLDRAIGRIHDAVLTKFLEAFFGMLPD